MKRRQKTSRHPQVLQDYEIYASDLLLLITSVVAEESGAEVALVSVAVCTGES